MTIVVLFFATCFLAYANGANDNFKGVATLFGSGTTSYHQAIVWATTATFAGSVCSIFLADTLVHNFSGKGLVPDSVAGSPEFLMAVALGAGATVLLAAVKGFPVSTTHGLIGALVGGGLMAVGGEVNISLLGNKFFLPLLASPLIAAVLGVFCYLVFHKLRIQMGLAKEWCLCVGESEQRVPIPQPASVFSRAASAPLSISLNSVENCRVRYCGQIIGVSTQQLLDMAHFASAGIVSFARGLNDTPKIMALLISAQALGVEQGMLAVGLGMAMGGLLNARRVAKTMSMRITRINHGQGFTANLVTGILVIFASRFGLPVSTTHVSVGTLFGIGMITRQANLSVVMEIILSWVLTLPIAAILSAGVYWGLIYCGKAGFLANLG